MNDSSHLVTLLQALGDRTRLRLLNLMAAGEVCVCFFVEVLGEPQPKISRHLATLRHAGLVAARRQGKWMHYALTPLANPEEAQVVASTLAVLRNERQMKRDLVALQKACCAPRLSPTLQAAPKPQLHAV